MEKEAKRGKRKKSSKLAKNNACKSVYLWGGGTDRENALENFPPRRKNRQKERMTYIEDRRDRYGLTHNMGMSTQSMEGGRGASQSKARLRFVFLYIFFNSLFHNDDLIFLFFSFYTDTIQSKSQISLQNIQQIEPNIAVPTKYRMDKKRHYVHIVLIGNVCIEYHYK